MMYDDTMIIVDQAQEKLTLTRSNIRRVCGLNGFTIIELAAHLGIARQTVYDAVSFPARWPDAAKRVNEALPIRSLPNEN